MQQSTCECFILNKTKDAVLFLDFLFCSFSFSCNGKSYIELSNQYGRPLFFYFRKLLFFVVKLRFYFVFPRPYVNAQFYIFYLFSCVDKKFTLKVTQNVVIYVQIARQFNTEALRNVFIFLVRITKWTDCFILNIYKVWLNQTKLSKILRQCCQTLLSFGNIENTNTFC